MADRALKRKRAEAEMDAELVHIEREKTREGIFHELVRERNVDAISVFLARLELISA
jgi:hypothetical protein